MRFHSLAFAAALVTVGSTAEAQTIQVLMQAGDVIPGVGVVDAGISSPFDNVGVNDNGDWVIEFEHDDTDQDVLYKNGAVFFQAGDPEPSGTIPGATISTALSSIRDWRLHNSGEITSSLILLGTPGGSADNNGVYIDNTLVLLEGQAPFSANWGAGTLVGESETMHLTGSGQMLLIGRNVDPTTAAVSDWYASMFTLNGMNQIVSETIIARSEQILPGLTGASATFGINTIRSGLYASATNSNGDAIFGASLVSGAPTTADSVIYHWSGTTQMLTKLAQEGDIEPLTGQPYSSIISPEFHLTNSGILTWKDQVSSPTADFIISNNAIFKFDGLVHPAFPGQTLTAFGNGYAKRLNDGRVLWAGDFSGGSAVDGGLFIDDDVIIQESVTMVNGMLVDDLTINNSGVYDISDNGRWLIFMGELNNVDTVFLADLSGPYESFCNGDGGDQMGCTNCPCGNNAAPGTTGGCLNSNSTSARLNPSGAPSVMADTMRYEVTGANVSTFGVLTSADNQLPQMGACPPGSGIASALLDGLRCVGGAAQRHGSRATDANGDIGVTNNGWGPPSGPAGGLIAQGGFVAGQTRHYQCFYREIGTLGCMTGQNTTDAVSVTFEP